MAITLVDLGGNNSTAGPTVTVGVTVPAGDLVYVTVFEKSASNITGSVTDPVNGTYNFYKGVSPNGSAAEGFMTSFYIWNAKALSVQNITYTKGTSGVFTQVNVLRASGIGTGNDPLDLNAGGTASGSSATPSITSGTFARTGELIINYLGWSAVGGDFFTQDSTNAAYASPPPVANNSGSAEANAGGFLVRTSLAPILYAPVLNNSRPWAIIQAVFAPPGTPGRDDCATLMGI